MAIGVRAQVCIALVRDNPGITYGTLRRRLRDACGIKLYHATRAVERAVKGGYLTKTFSTGSSESDVIELRKPLA